MARTALTGSDDGVARFWEVPLPVAGEVNRIVTVGASPHRGAMGSGR